MPIRILLVDDDPSVSQMLRTILSRGDYDVVADALDGSTALQKYEELQPDVVLLDIMMSGAEDGLTTLGKILAKDSRARVIMCSALSSKEVMNQAFKAGAWDFVIKPFTLERVRRAIDNAAA